MNIQLRLKLRLEKSLIKKRVSYISSAHSDQSEFLPTTIAIQITHKINISDQSRHEALVKTYISYFCEASFAKYNIK